MDPRVRIQPLSSCQAHGALPMSGRALWRAPILLSSRRLAIHIFSRSVSYRPPRTSVFHPLRGGSASRHPGGVPEWSNGPVLKTGVAFGSPWVRIPPPPLAAEAALKKSCRHQTPVLCNEVGVGFEPTGFAQQSAPWVRRPEGAPRRRVRERVLGGKAAKQPCVAEGSVERSETQSHRAFSFGFGF